ncbi:hypothetical protein SAMN05660662_2390 [Blastococcus aurantiacus]|uniref:Uncharacterized protein n=1 Tax=Blastococcus aurantiacus TaxID=1550231 RepID=A0A1G7LL95_9ACTN|nr:hypothetical protein [Blastococcus aurantiacus]SDF50288.1 hypothetical protein SAMN05660662_2390 [Blastococcus aurantiacus]
MSRPTAPPPTDAESHEIQLRSQFGLRSDLPYVRTVDADPRSTTDRLGIPLTPEESADIEARSSTVRVLGAAAQDLDGYGGIWIDQAAGGVIHLGVAGSWSEETIQRLRSLVPAGQQLVLEEVAVSLAELESLLERLNDAVLSDPSLRVHLAGLYLEEQNNAVRLTMLTDTPQELLDQVEQEFGGPGFVLDSAAEGGYSYD